MKWNLEKRGVKDLLLYAKNARSLSKESAAHLVKSIETFGICEPIVVNADGTVIGGHQRLAVLKKLKHKEVECYVCEAQLDERQVQELNIRLNKNVGEWDWEMLANAWDPNDLLEWGFTEAELEIATQIEEEPPADEAPALPKKTIIKRGDMITFAGSYAPAIERHVLVCGDCRQSSPVETCLGAVTVDMLLTDPPYGVNYAEKSDVISKSRGGKPNITPIQNDAIEDYRHFFREFLSLIRWSDYNTLYVFMSGQELHNLRGAMDDCEIRWGDYLIWWKNQPILSRKDYNSSHEFIVYGWYGKHKFYGPTNACTIIEHDKPQSSKLHPTMKPVDLLGRLIKDGGADEAVIYDPFAGSGSSLMAAASLGRRWRGIEISEHYCDVIVRRYMEWDADVIIRINGQIVDKAQFTG